MKPNLSHYEEGAATALLDSGESVRKVRNYLEAAWMDRHDTGHIPGAHVTRIKQAVRQLRDSMLDTSLFDPIIIHTIQIPATDVMESFEGINVRLPAAPACPDCGEPFVDTPNGPWCGRSACEGEARRRLQVRAFREAFDRAWGAIAARRADMETMTLSPRQFMARSQNVDRARRSLFPICVCELAPEECKLH